MKHSGFIKNRYLADITTPNSSLSAIMAETRGSELVPPASRMQPAVFALHLPQGRCLKGAHAASHPGMPSLREVVS